MVTDARLVRVGMATLGGDYDQPGESGPEPSEPTEPRPQTQPQPGVCLDGRKRSLRKITGHIATLKTGMTHELKQVRRIHGRDADDLTKLDEEHSSYRDRMLEIEAEIDRRCCFLRPHGSTRQVWDAVQVMLLCYVAIVVPWRLGFGLYLVPGTVGWWWEAGVDAFFIGDIVMNFRTAYWDERTGHLIVSPKQIQRRYLATWFVLDVIACLPLSYLLLLLGSDGEASQQTMTTKVAKLVRLAKFTKMLRLARIKRIYQHYEDHFYVLQRARKWIQVFSVLAVILYSNHVQCCIWYALGGSSQQLGVAGATSPAGSSLSYIVDGWLVRAGYLRIEENEEVDVVSLGTRYLAALYWSVTTWTTVGYGDYLPVTNAEKVYACLAQIFGGLMFGILVARMSDIVSRGSIADAKLRERTRHISEFLRVKNVPLGLRRKIRVFFELLFAQETAFSNQEIVELLSPGLKKDMIDHLYLHVIGQIVLLRKVEDRTVMKICTKLRNAVYEKGQMIMQEGDDSSDLFVVLSGEIKITRQRVYIGSLGAGSFFGEDAVCEYYIKGREDGLRTRRTESAESVYQSSVAYLDRETCADLMDGSWQFRVNVLQAYTRRHAHGERRVKEIKSLRWRAVASRVEVTVQLAEGLPIMDIDGNSDPYIVALVRDGSKDEQKRTVTKENAGSNPVWGHPLPEDKVTALKRTTGQTLLFPSTTARTVEIEAWDDDGLFSGDDLIGTGRIQVPKPATDEVAAQDEENVVTAWVQLMRKTSHDKLVPSGRVLVSIKCWRLPGRKSFFSLGKTAMTRRTVDRKYRNEQQQIEEKAAVMIQTVWRSKSVRLGLQLSRHEEKVWTRRGRKRAQTAFQARTERQKVVHSKLHLTSTLYDRVCQRLLEEMEAQVNQGAVKERSEQNGAQALVELNQRQASELVTNKQVVANESTEQLVERLEQMAQRQDRFLKAVETARTSMEVLATRIISIQGKLTFRKQWLQDNQQQACTPTRNSDRASQQDGNNGSASDNDGDKQINQHQQEQHQPAGQKQQTRPTVLVLESSSGHSLAVSPPGSFENRTCTPGLLPTQTLPELVREPARMDSNPYILDEHVSAVVHDTSTTVADGNTSTEDKVVLSRAGSKLLP